MTIHAFLFIGSDYYIEQIELLYLGGLSVIKKSHILWLDYSCCRNSCSDQKSMGGDNIGFSIVVFLVYLLYKKSER